MIREFNRALSLTAFTFGVILLLSMLFRCFTAAHSPPRDASVGQHLAASFAPVSAGAEAGGNKPVREQS